MSGGIDSDRIRSWLITALLVFVAGNILLSIIKPLVPILLVGVVILTIAIWLHRSGTH